MKNTMRSFSGTAAAALISLLLLSSCARVFLPPFPFGKPEGVYHTVQKGQTLWRICKTYHASLEEVAELNRISKSLQINAGQKIFIPGAKKILPVPATVRPPPPPPKIHYSSGLFDWPLRGKIIKNFGMLNGIKHDGVNISAREGAPVKAARSGKVIFASVLEGYGNTIILQHKDHYVTVYAGNKTNLVEKGNWVGKGHEIARVGRPFNTQEQPQLHFQIRRYNKPRNPLYYLPKQSPFE